MTGIPLTQRDVFLIIFLLYYIRKCFPIDETPVES